jgi:hypothetical protein
MGPALSVIGEIAKACEWANRSHRKGCSWSRLVFIQYRVQPSVLSSHSGIKDNAANGKLLVSVEPMFFRPLLLENHATDGLNYPLYRSLTTNGTNNEA